MADSSPPTPILSPEDFLNALANVAALHGWNKETMRQLAPFSSLTVSHEALRDAVAILTEERDALLAALSRQGTGSQ